jgi:2,3-dihydroxybenzoate-AMP ligase
LIRLINDSEIGNFDLSSMRQNQSGGQRMQPEVRARTRELIPTALVQENFGMSEGLLMFVRHDDPDDVLMETCGRPVCADDEVRLIDDDGREVAKGEVGELCCRGPYTLRGYFGVPEYNARQFTPDGFYRSGDLMRQHPSGNYVVEGRKKDLINRGGEKISAEEVELLLLRHPRVRHAAVVPMPDARLGERTCAFLVVDGEPLTLADVREHFAGLQVAKFKWPERIEHLAEIPRTLVGKVDKKRLQATAAEGAS